MAGKRKRADAASGHQSEDEDDVRLQGPSRLPFQGQQVSGKAERPSAEPGLEMPSHEEIAGPSGVQHVQKLQAQQDAARQRFERNLSRMRETTMEVAEREKRTAPRVTQNSRKARSLTPDGPQGEAGTIKHVYIQNFMCHKAREFYFNPSVTFVTGNNGSGKSAALTAITVALGGKTAATGRGSGVKDLVKSGADEAIVRITLRNTGISAVYPDTYGPEITIERVIKASGASTWKVLAGNPKRSMPQQPRKIVDEICEMLNLQVDNPLTVLTQDQARAFLSNADGKKKYDMFMKCTQLDACQEYVDRAHEDLVALQQEIELISQALLVSKTSRDEWQKLYDEALIIQKAKDEIEQLENQLIWAYATRQEAEVEKTRLESDRHLQQVDKARERLDQTQNDIKEVQQKMEDAKAKQIQIEEEYKSFREEYKKHEEQYRRAQSEVKTHQPALSDLNRVIAQQMKRKKDLQAQRDDEIKRLGQRDTDEKRARLSQEREDLSQKMKSLRDNIAASQRNIDTNLNQLRNLRKETGNREEQRKNLLASVKGIEAAITEIEHIMKGNDTYGRYGLNYKNVLNEINKVTQRKGWYGELPLGPLGKYIMLKPGMERYIEVFDSVLGSFMTSWAVTDQRDRATLLTIFHRCVEKLGVVFNTGLRDRRSIPSVITHAGDKFDYSSGDLSAKGETMLSTLSIHHADVVRLAVNQIKVETVFVKPTRQEAEQMARHIAASSSMRNFPGIISADMQRTQATRTGGMQNIVQQPWIGTSLLATDMVGKKKEKESELSIAQEELRAFSLDLEGQEEAIATKQSEIDRLEADRRHLRNELATAEDGYQKIDAELRQENPINIAAIDESIAEVDANLNQNLSQYEHLQALVNDLKNNISGLKLTHAELRAQEGARQVERNKVQDAVDALESETNLKEKSKRGLEASLLRLEEKGSEIQGRLRQSQSTLERVLEEALSKHPERIDSPQSPEVLERGLSAAKKALARNHDGNRLSLGEIKEKLAQAREKVDKQQNVFDMLVSLSKGSAKDVRRGQRQVNELCESLTRRAQRQFSKHLEKRMFTGTLHIDHQEKMLSIRVRTEQEAGAGGRDRIANGASAKDPKALSGGETSFTTICLLLALWDCVSSPLRCLDEFDVYMDAHNRKMSMNMLIEAAKARKQQFLFITPQSMSHIKDDPAISILRMPDPDRTQSVLPFQAAQSSEG